MEMEKINEKKKIYIIFSMLVILSVGERKGKGAN